MIKVLYFYLYFFVFYIFFKKSKNIILEDKFPIEIINNNLELIGIPKIIWIYWHDFNMPQLVRVCVSNIIRLHPDYEIHVLNHKTIKEYIDIDIDTLCNMIPIANLSDLIRLKLLKKYGGVWIDASVILEENIEDFFLVKENRFEIIGFHNLYQSKHSNIPVIESWLLASPPNSKFINSWLSFFEPIVKLGNVGLFKEFEKRKDFKDLCTGLGNPQYLIVYIAAKLAYQDMLNKCNMKFYCCDNSAFAVQIFSKWRTRKCIVNYYIKDKFILSPIYKLTSGDRKYYEFLNKYKIINKDSIIGRFVRRAGND